MVWSHGGGGGGGGGGAGFAQGWEGLRAGACVVELARGRAAARDPGGRGGGTGEGGGAVAAA